MKASHAELGEYTLLCDGGPELLFTENESNAARLWGQQNRTPYVKDAFHEYVVSGQTSAVDPAKSGTKGAAHYVLQIPAAGHAAIQLRLQAKSTAAALGSDFDSEFNARVAEANEFYECITPEKLTEDERRVHRQALAGMLWTKQYYLFDVDEWLCEHGTHRMSGALPKFARNARLVPHVEQ